MRRLLIIFIFISLGTSIYSQDTIPKKYYRHCIGLSIGSDFGLNVSPFFALNAYKHKVGIGLLVGRTSICDYSSGYYYSVDICEPPNEFFSYSDNININGATVFYDFLPKHLSKPDCRISKSDDPNFNIILSARFNVIREIFNFRDEHNIVSFVPLLGVGFRIKILKSFVISQRFESGYRLRTGNKSLYNNPSQSYAQYGGIFSIKLGIEVNFNKK